jgi:hypothetical protein
VPVAGELRGGGGGATTYVVAAAARLSLHAPPLMPMKKERTEMQGKEEREKEVLFGWGGVREGAEGGSGAERVEEGGEGRRRSGRLGGGLDPIWIESLRGRP